MDYQIIGQLIYRRIGCTAHLSMARLVEEVLIIILIDKEGLIIQVGMEGVKDVVQDIQVSLWEEAEVEVVVAVDMAAVVVGVEAIINLNEY